MIPVSRIYNRAKNIVDACSDEALFEHLTDAVEMLANKGDFDPLLGVVDITAQGKVVTLPRDIETILGVNISGSPAIGRDRLFNFHLNGPGDNMRPSCWRWWKDGFQSPTFRDLEAPSQLSASVAEATDVGAEVWVEGYAVDGTEIRSLVSGVWVTGYKVPTTQVGGTPAPAIGSPVFGRITRVRTSLRNNSVSLFATANSVTTLIGLYQWDETEPRLRRMEVDKPACWVRVAFRRRVFEIRHVTDLIPLHSSLAILEALRAVVAYASDDISTGMGHEANALRFLSDKEKSLAAPITRPVQIDPRNLLHDKSDEVD